MSLLETREYKRYFTELGNREVIVPVGGLADVFDKTVTPSLALTSALRRQSPNLSQTRDLLLPKLISGEVDVSELDVDTGGQEA